MNRVRTRYAPSPTGRMHVGNLRTALYAYLIAKHEGGDFLLRIEDTDQERYVEGAVEIIYQTLKDTGLIHDEGPDKDGGCGPYVQSERHKAGIYMEYAKMLVEKGEAYYCFCTPERLESLRRTVNGEEIMSYDKHCLSLSREEVEHDYERNLGRVIVERFEAIDPASMCAVLAPGHGPFTWGRSPEEAVEHSVILEELARMAKLSADINGGKAPVLPEYMAEKHYMRKFGPEAYFYQNR